MRTKNCTNCNLPKELTEFYTDKKSSDGKQSWCKICKRESVRNAPSTGKRTKEQGRERYRKNKITYNISRRIRQSLRTKKTTNWESLVGYSLGELKTHLEKLFTKGMSWENYGGVWHIDHIKPISLFNIESDSCEHFKECWSLNNLQPLFVLDNLRKSNKYSRVV